MLQERRNHILQKVTEKGKVRDADLSRDLSGLGCKQDKYGFAEQQRVYPKSRA